MVAYMRKRVANGAAIRAIIDARDDLVGSRVCIAAGMSHAHLSNAMAGRKPLTEASLGRLALVMGVPIDAISHETYTCNHEPTEAAG